MSQPRLHGLERVVLDCVGIRHDLVDDCVRHDHHSNLVVGVRLADGRLLVIKRARAPHLARFAVSSKASRLLANAGVRAPVHLPLGDLPDDGVVAYWWLAHPTLDRVWRERDDKRSYAASWGRMMRRVHAVRVPGHGPLDAPMSSLHGFLRLDLGQRLRPAVEHAWPAAIASLDALLALAPRVPSADAVLVHGDLFDRNVLVDRATDEVVGVLDLEDVFGGPPEADLARTEVLHGPLFRDPLDGHWLEHIVLGAGYRPDPRRLSCFRGLSLLNMGLHAAVVGYASHAADLVDALEAEVGAFGSGRSHREVVGGTLTTAEDA